MKRTQTIIFLLFNSCVFTSLFAQDAEVDQPKKEIYIKGYVNFLYFNSGYHPNYHNFEKEFFRFWAVTPAVSFRNLESLKVHELEPKFWYSNRDNVKEYEFGLRYELCWYLKKEIVSGLRFRWGGSSRIYYYKADIAFDPMFNNPTKEQNGGLELSLAAHLEYQIFKKIKVELTTSNLNINFALDYHYTDNPLLTESQKTQGGFDFEIFNQRILRLGIGFKL